MFSRRSLFALLAGAAATPFIKVPMIAPGPAAVAPALSMTMDEYAERFIKPAMARLANDFDRDMWVAAKDIGGWKA